jgi:hypothetical protein
VALDKGIVALECGAFKQVAEMQGFLEGPRWKSGLIYVAAQQRLT